MQRRVAGRGWGAAIPGENRNHENGCCGSPVVAVSRVVACADQTGAAAWAARSRGGVRGLPMKLDVISALVHLVDLCWVRVVKLGLPRHQHRKGPVVLDVACRAAGLFRGRRGHGAHGEVWGAEHFANALSQGARGVDWIGCPIRSRAPRPFIFQWFSGGLRGSDQGEKEGSHVISLLNTKKFRSMIHPDQIHR